VAIEDVERLKKYVLAEGDIVFSRVGSVDRRALISENEVGWLFSGRLLRVRPDPKRVDPTYLSYFFGLPAFKRYIRSIAVGATMPSLNTELLSNVPVILPSHAEQLAIARLLSDLDMKLKANGSLAKLLEEIVHTIFKSWFIDFDPVKAKMAGEAPVGMDAETAALFPDSMEESELGEIPTGWSVGIFVNFFHLVMGQSPPGSAYNSEGVGEPFFQGRAEFGERFPTQRLSSTLGNRRAAKGDVLVSVRAPVGDQNQALVDCIIGRGLAAIRHESGSQAYSYEFVRSIQSQLDFFNGQGTVFGSISKRDFESLQVLEPPDSLVQAFDSICSPIDELLRNLHLQNESLAAIRDALLPRLISGELQIPDEMLAA
jgi:type I restriction enzyme S subunit